MSCWRCASSSLEAVAGAVCERMASDNGDHVETHGDCSCGVVQE
jgi:hypothetical protein